MGDFKTDLGIKLMIALVLATLVSFFIAPMVQVYLGILPALWTCANADWSCSIIYAIMSYVIPAIALFLPIFLLIEVLAK